MFIRTLPLIFDKEIDLSKSKRATMAKYFNILHEQTSREKILSFRQKYFFLIVLILFTCNHPTENENNYRIFPVLLESDLDYTIVKSNGTIWTWGGNSSGQLGNKTMTPSEQPIQVINLKNIISLDLRDGAGYAADEEGNIWFWGYRLIWVYDTVVVIPKKISLVTGVKQLQISSGVTLLKDGGTVWRINWDYTYPTQYLSPEIIGGMVNIKKISGGLALQNNDDLCEFPDRAWVEAKNGGLGDELISDVQDVQNISMSHTILLKNDGTVWAWGRNKGGYLGDGTFDDNPVPSQIDTLKNIIAISANGSRCPALKNNRTVWFWGMVHVDLNQDV